MKPASFEYFRPDSLDEALALMADRPGEIKPLAGGQSLVPAMNFRLAAPRALVDLNRIASLSTIRTGADGGLVIGGMVRHRTLEQSAFVAEAVPLLQEVMPHVAHPPIRTRGTLGGSLAHADPAAELPAVMLALDASVGVRSRARRREVAAQDFFVGLYTTALEPDELVTEVTVPRLGPGSGWAFAEVARRHGDFALAGVAVVVSLDTGGRTASARIALVGLHERAVLAERAAEALSGEPPSDEAIRAAAQAAAHEDADPSADIHASVAYRRHLCGVLTRRALERAFERAAAQLDQGL